MEEKKKEYFKTYLKENRERLLKYKKEWYNNNIDRIKEKNKKWRKDNKDIIKQNKNNPVIWNSSYPNKIKLYEEIRQDGEFLEVKCTYCGKWYKPKYKEIQARIDVINGTMSGEHRLYCSNNCKKECPIFNQTKWPKEFKKATSREVQPELRQMVLERDNYTCQKCFKTDVPLHCHHREGINWEPIESADMDMCITYCKNCHKEVHQIDGCGYNDMKCN